MEDVLRVLRPMSKSLNVTTIFLVTDGTDLLQQASQYNGTEFAIKTNADVKHAVNGRDCVRESNVGCTVGISNDETTFSVLLDLEVLSSGCKYFVGTLGSTFTKMALLRGIGNGIIVHDGISLE